jgi:hypothetical protein
MNPGNHGQRLASRRTARFIVPFVYDMFSFRKSSRQRERV